MPDYAAMNQLMDVLGSYDGFIPAASDSRTLPPPGKAGFPAVFAQAALLNQRFKAVTHRAPQVSPTWDSHNSALGKHPWLQLIGTEM